MLCLKTSQRIHASNLNVEKTQAFFFYFQPHKAKLNKEEDKDKRAMYERILNKVQAAVKMVKDSQENSEDTQAQAREVLVSNLMIY